VGRASAGSGLRGIAWLSLLITACSAHDPPTAAPKETIAPARDAARLVLEKHCGGCHRPDQPTANEKALKVYDLSEPDWSARMSDTQLDDADVRLTETGSTAGGPVSALDKQTLRAYVAAEKARRQSTTTRSSTRLAPR
jgi:hypothetical protein